jgi:hypothetical protein
MSSQLPNQADLEALLRAHAEANDWELSEDQLQRAVAYLRSTRVAFDGRCHIDLETRRLCVRARGKDIVLAASDPEDQAALNQLLSGTVDHHLGVLAGVVAPSRPERRSE